MLGLVFALIGQSPNRYISTAMAEILEFIRSTPLLLQVFLRLFRRPAVRHRHPCLDSWRGRARHPLRAIARSVTAAVSRMLKWAIWEACTALKLSRTRSWRAIILPQAIQPIVPDLGNYFIGMFKDTPILAAIAILEMLQQAKNFGTDNYRYIEAITMVGFFYFVFSLIFRDRAVGELPAQPPLPSAQ